MPTCTYRGSHLAAYDPVYVEDAVDGEREPAGQFCNDGCLSAHVEEAGLADGAAWEWTPE